MNCSSLPVSDALGAMKASSQREARVVPVALQHPPLHHRVIVVQLAQGEEEGAANGRNDRRVCHTWAAAQSCCNCQCLLLLDPVKPMRQSSASLHPGELRPAARARGQPQTSGQHESGRGAIING